MLKVKHFMDAVEPDDGCRLWVESAGLTRDLREWCRVDVVLSRFGPPRQLWDWFEERGGGGGAYAYGFFRGAYHVHLSRRPDRHLLQDIAGRAMHEDFTLLHQGEDPEHNTARALYEFMTELQSYCRRD